MAQAKPDKKTEVKQEVVAEEVAVADEATGERRQRYIKVVATSAATITSLNPNFVETGITIPEDCVGFLRFYPGGDYNTTRRLACSQTVFTPCEQVTVKLAIHGQNASHRVNVGRFLGTLILMKVDDYLE